MLSDSGTMTHALNFNARCYGFWMRMANSNIKYDQQGTKYVPPLKIPACVIWFTNYLPHIHKATADTNTRPNILTFFLRVKVADDYRIICILWALKIRRLAELCFCENDLLFLGRLLSDHLLLSRLFLCSKLNNLVQNTNAPFTALLVILQRHRPLCNHGMHSLTNPNCTLLWFT